MVFSLLSMVSVVFLPSEYATSVFLKSRGLLSIDVDSVVRNAEPSAFIQLYLACISCIVFLLMMSLVFLSTLLYLLLAMRYSVFDAGWPTYDEKAMEDDEIEVVVQVNGKMKGKISVAKDIAQADAIATAKEMLGDKLTGNIVKEIYVPGRIVNIVAK